MPSIVTDTTSIIGTRSGTYMIASYLRISHEDDMRDESNSITNQRDLIMSFIASQGEFQNACVTDYVDDGKSGESTNRREYQRLMTDVERGVVECIIVKDLSRIGRNLLDVDDLLMNYLVTQGVRFIAINNGYDSFKHPLSNLELAVINLANQHYNRDLAQKSITVKNMKQKRGEYLAQAPFGYKKSTTEKNKLVLDDEAAGYVRLIFSLACEGHRSMEIAQILNTQDIPSPSVYKIRKGHKNIWTQAIDPNYCFWTNSVIRKLIKNEVYLGRAVSNKFKVIEFGTGRTVPRPRDEWIIVPNMHEPLVTEANFKKAQLILPKKRYDDPPGHIFGNKIKCPACGHAMIHYTRSNPRFKCGTAKYTDHYGCLTYKILQSDIEKAVLSSVRTHATSLIDTEEAKLYILQQGETEKTELTDKLKLEENAIKVMEESISKYFTQLVSEKITKDAFVNKKDAINKAIEQKKAEVVFIQERLHDLTIGKGKVEERLAELRTLVIIEKVDRALVDLMIDRILVHDEQEIEIVWADRFL